MRSVTDGLELAGCNASWLLEPGRLRIRYGTGMRTHALLKALGETSVSDEALAGVTVAAGRSKTVLQLDIRPGADPLLEAAAGQLPDEAHPYRLVLEPGDQDLAEYYAGTLHDRVAFNPHAGEPSAEYLVSGPPPPRILRGYDGQGTFDGSTVELRWAWSGATSRKWAAGHQSFPLAGIEGVEWVAGGRSAGHLRLRIAGREAPQEAENDPAALIFGFGYGLLAESLPFAASVLASLRRHRAVQPVGRPVDQRTATVPEYQARHRVREEQQTVPPAGTDQIIAAIGKLGELRDAGLLTDTEFDQKKSELLGRL